MKPGRWHGFTLAELLVSVAILVVIAVVAVPLLSSQDPKKLEVAAAHIGGALRFALGEANRSGGYVLVDAKSTPGQLKAFFSDSAGNPGAALVDPGTKRALVIDTAGSAFSANVGITPKFMRGGTAWAQLLIGPGGQLQAFDGPSNNKGTLQAGSGIVVALGTQNLTVSVNEVTGFVALP